MPLSGDGPSFRIIAKWGGFFEERSGFGIGEEFFLMFNLERLLLNDPMAHGGMGGTMVMGPMIMVGKIDPSTNFSYPANRQYILNVPGRIEAGGIRRFTLAPYAFASKFFGMETGEGEPVEVTKEVLYNTTGDFGLDLHKELGCFICHREDGRGTKIPLHDERGLSIKPVDPTRQETFGNGTSHEDIYRTIMTGLDGTPMPGSSRSSGRRRRARGIWFISFSPFRGGRGEEIGLASGGERDRVRLLWRSGADSLWSHSDHPTAEIWIGSTRRGIMMSMLASGYLLSRSNV